MIVDLTQEKDNDDEKEDENGRAASSESAQFFQKEETGMKSTATATDVSRARRKAPEKAGEAFTADSRELSDSDSGGKQMQRM